MSVCIIFFKGLWSVMSINFFSIFNYFLQILIRQGQIKAKKYQITMQIIFQKICTLCFFYRKMSEKYHTFFPESGCDDPKYLTFIKAVSILPLGDATAIFFSSPAFTMVLSTIILKDHCGIFRTLIGKQSSVPWYLH